MNKKGEMVSDVPSKMLKWTIMGILWGACLIFLIMLMAKYKVSVVYFPPEVEDNVLAYRFLYAPNCLAYQDDAGRVYAGVIDWDKLEDQTKAAETIKRCYSAGAQSEAPAFRIVVKKQSEIRSVETTNFGSAPSIMLTKPVVIKDGENFVAGEVEFYIRE